MTEMLDLDVAGETVGAYVPDSSGESAPGVAVYHPWWGLNDDVKAFADRLAGAGFFVIAPDFFNGSIATEIPDAERLARSADDDRCGSIGLAAVDRLLGRQGSSAKVGTVGFSFGAAWTVWVATQRPQVVASVVYYGTWVDDVLAEASTPMLGHFAEDDPYEDAETVDAFEKRLVDAGRDTTIHRYRGTGHWFAEPSRDAYRAEAAELAFERTVAFLREHLAA